MPDSREDAGRVRLEMTRVGTNKATASIASEISPSNSIPLEGWWGRRSSLCMATLPLPAVSGCNAESDAGMDSITGSGSEAGLEFEFGPDFETNPDSLASLVKDVPSTSEHTITPAMVSHQMPNRVAAFVFCACFKSSETVRTMIAPIQRLWSPIRVTLPDSMPSESNSASMITPPVSHFLLSSV